MSGQVGAGPAQNHEGESDGPVPQPGGETEEVHQLVDVGRNEHDDSHQTLGMTRVN